MSYPELPAENTNPWFTAISDAWAALKDYIDGGDVGGGYSGPNITTGPSYPSTPSVGDIHITTP